MGRITILCGSPRDKGKSLDFANELFEQTIERNPELEVTLISIADMDISGCVGCNGCKESFQCVIEDDAQDILECVRESEEVTIASPIYMAGVPSQLKALLDRFQPFFWEGVRHVGERKKAFLHLFGEGNDPYGADGAILSLKSALHVAGFEVEDVEIHIN